MTTSLKSVYFSLAAVLGAGFALQSTAAEISVVGNLDASAVISKVKGQDTKVQTTSGFRHGTSFGIMGKEDLGAGYEIGFFLDQGFSLMNGTVTDGDTDSSAFSREAMLYAKGEFGQFGFGRFGTLSSGTGSFTLLSGWVFGTTYTTAAWSEFGRTIPQYRLDNAVAYVSPNFNGLTLSLMYSNGTTSDTNRWSRNNHYYGAGFKYQGHGLLTSLLLETADHKNPDSLGNRGRQYEINYGIEIDFGGFTAMAAYQYNAQENGIKDHVFGISGRVPVFGGNVLVGTRMLLGKDETKGISADTDKRQAWSVNAAYEYPLSKSTTLWAYGSLADGTKRLSTTYESGRVVNFNGWQTVAGLTHKF